jgi:beta-glucosidase/6-phospho-beta-glucosidase/beta-galactosidase
LRSSGDVASGSSFASRPLEHCLEGRGFLWLTGIEDTFITARDARTGRTLDEYALTGHYESWHSDLQLAGELGVVAMRYGIPWHRINPGPDQWDFSWPDATFDRLLSLGIHPIVDLVHYGTPGWMANAFLHPDYDRYVEEYAFRIAERYRGTVRYYTPFNEPRITAWYCGKLGWWPPYRHGYGGFVAVMGAICRGIVKTQRALKSVDAEILCVHADASDLYEAAEPSLVAVAAHLQELGFLALDLSTGRVTAEHPLRTWLTRLGLTDSALDWFLENACTPDGLGINLYPMFSRKVVHRVRGRRRIAMPYADAIIVERLAALYHERYRLPILITETASRGSMRRRRAWLAQSVEAAARTRQRGVPLVGYTWWPMFALVRWAYLRGKKPVSEYLEQMGLWDLLPDANGKLQRQETPLVDDFRRLAANGVLP